MDKSTIISTKDLCKTFISGGVQFNATKNISMEIYEGDFTVIMGSSGSGKSTLLYLLSGLERATAGNVHAGGGKISEMTEKELSIFRRDHIGFIFQAINLVPNLSILENIIVPRLLVEKNRKAAVGSALALLEAVGLTLEAQRLPSQVSGGEQQRAAIARALINKPKILMADEPTGSLNSTHGKNVLDILTRLNSEGQTIIMVTHDLKAACRANRILFLKDGQLNGELLPGKYNEDNLAERENRIYAWLSERGW
jgi:putative ABC transport system ATP-binding protein